MPFKSEAQRRLFYAKQKRGEIDAATVQQWETETGDRRLPEKVVRNRNTSPTSKPSPTRRKTGTVAKARKIKAVGSTSRYRKKR